jgi:translation initiation factor 1
VGCVPPAIFFQQTENFTKKQENAMTGRRDDPVLVYSTERGLVCPRCRTPVAKCACRREDPPPAGDGVVRVRRETKGRGGKTVTTVSGVPLAGSALKELASELKRRCGTGGTLKDGVIEIQGDHRDAIVEAISGRGFTVKRAGG